MKHIINRLVVLILLTTSLTSCLNDRECTPKIYKVSKPIQGYYATDHTGAHSFDLYQPKTKNNSQKRPLIIFAHGGAFLVGEKEEEKMVRLSRNFARIGYVTASINYSLVEGKTMVGNIVHKSIASIFGIAVENYYKKQILQSIRDGKTAVRYFRAHAEKFNIDADNIFFVGYSAGAVIGLHTAFLDESEAIKEFEEGCLECGDWQGFSSEVKGVVSIAGAMFNRTHINEDDDVSILLIHGAKDGIIPSKRGKAFEGYMDDDIIFDIPGLGFELGISNYLAGREIHSINFKTNAQFLITEDFLKIVKYLMPEVSGAEGLSVTLDEEDMPYESYIIEGGTHELMYDKRGNQTPEFNEIECQIANFISSLVTPIENDYQADDMEELEDTPVYRDSNDDESNGGLLLGMFILLLLGIAIFVTKR